jgi:hypothetical protein
VKILELEYKVLLLVLARLTLRLKLIYVSFEFSMGRSSHRFRAPTRKISDAKVRIKDKSKDLSNLLRSDQRRLFPLRYSLCKAKFVLDVVRTGPTPAKPTFHEAGILDFTSWS